MEFKKVDLAFLHANSPYKDAKVILFGAMLDITTSFRPGTRFAGNEIRVNSSGIDSYSTHQNLKLEDFATLDIGDIEMPLGDLTASLEIIEETTARIIRDDKIPLMIGGEHLVTYPAIKAMIKKYPNLHLIHFDAHTDLRDEFLGMKYSHATVIRRCHDLLGDGRIFQYGIRSSSEDVFKWTKGNHTFINYYDLANLDVAIEKIKDNPVYISIDLDVLDPSVFPGTGSPEPGGVSYKELLAALNKIATLKNIVGADVVELSPLIDTSGISTLTAIKTIREMILIMHQKKD